MSNNKENNEKIQQIEISLKMEEGHLQQIEFNYSQDLKIY